MLLPIVSSAQFEEYEGWDTLAIGSDGRDTIIYLGDDTSGVPGARLMNNQLLQVDHPSIAESARTVEIIPYTVTFGTYSENVNQNLFGVNISGMFTQNTLPIGPATDEQWQWMSDLAPEMIRFPSGEFGEFAHLLHNINDGSPALGYGFDIVEIFRYFDKTDDVIESPQPTEAELIAALDNITLIESWVDDRFASKFNQFIEACFFQNLLDDDAGGVIEEDDTYISQFIKLIQRIETDNPGHRVKVVVCLNISSETPAECKEIVEYLRDNDIYDCQVEGVEMGNEIGDEFHCKVLGFSNFHKYYAYLTGSTEYASEWDDVIIDNPADPNDLYSSHDFIRTFKKNLMFTTRVGVCAIPLPNETGAVFKMESGGGTACSIDPNWNTQLVSYYTDTVGVVDFPDMFRMSFDGVILHPYYAAKNYETYINTPENTSIPISQLNAEIGTTGFGYDCIDPLDPLDGGKWRYDIYDERLRGAFDGDADGIGIRTNFKNFMKLEYRNTYDLYNDVLHFEYSPGLVQGGKWLWTTEWNIKDEDRDESNYNNKLIGVYTNSFMHALLMQEWWLKNLKLNFQSGYRKNFFLFSTLQNYAGGAGKDMLTLADNSELLDLGLSPSTAYYTKRAPYQAMLLLSEITEQNLKYLPSTYGLPAIDVNLQPTSFIDPLKENIYVYYTNVTASAINYKLNTDNLTAFFPGSDFVDPGVATIYSLQADKNYSTVGRSTLFDINECYDGATYMEDAQHPWDMQALELPYFNTPECTGTFDPDKCITVEPYSIGYFRVPIVPHYPRLMPENILYSEAPGDIQLYPNPASSFFAFTINEEAQDEIYTLEILNIEGAKLLEIKAVTGKPVDISQLPNGIYTVVINNSCFKKLVKS